MDEKRTIGELRQLQAYPLDVKIKKTEQRIKEWVDYYGEDGVYVSFSGGKDSTVLLDIARRMYPKIVAVFCDTGLEFPEIRDFVKTFENVVWIKPKVNFKKVIAEYGYPFISKEVSFALGAARHFLDHQEDYEGKKPLPVQKPTDKYKPYALLRLEGKLENGASQFNCPKWHFMLDAPWRFSSKCCNVMKKEPFKKYGKETGRKPITGQMAIESRLRTKVWLRNGCNAFNADKQISNPMSFWTEQDVLRYLKVNSIAIAKPYGDIVYTDDDGMEYEEAICPDGLKLKTTKLTRTGCMFCGYGCHLDGSDARFVHLRENYPKQYEYIMKPAEEGGLGYREVISWINEHGNLDIKM